MKVDILLFGITKDILGDNKYSLELNEGASVGELKALLTKQYPQLEKLKSLLVAVNSEYGQDDLLLKADDEIALIPPVSGG